MQCCLSVSIYCREWKVVESKVGGETMREYEQIEERKGKKAAGGQREYSTENEWRRVERQKQCVETWNRGWRERGTDKKKSRERNRRERWERERKRPRGGAGRETITSLERGQSRVGPGPTVNHRGCFVPFPSSGRHTNGWIHVGTKRLCSPQMELWKQQQYQQTPTITPRTASFISAKSRGWN